MTLDAAGNVLVAEYFGNQITRITPAGAKSTVVSGLNRPFSEIYDSSGNLYIGLLDGVQLLRLSPSGTLTPVATVNGVTGLAIDSSGNIIADAFLDSPPGVKRVTPAGAVTTLYNIYTPTGGVFDSAGNFYVASRDNDTVLKITPAGVQSNFATGQNRPEQMVFDNQGNLYVTNFGNGPGTTVSKITPAGVSSVFVTGLNGPRGLAIDNTNGILYISNWSGGGTGAGSITKVTGLPLPQPQTFFTDALTGPGSPNLATLPSGKYSYTASGLQRTSATGSTDRPMVTTALAGYLSQTNFVAQVDVTGASGDLIYFGLGQGDTDAGYNNEPAHTFYFRVHSGFLLGGVPQYPLQADVRSTTTTDNGFLAINTPTNYSPGTKVTLRIIRAGDQLTMEALSGNTILGSAVNYSFSAYSASLGLNATNTRLFFGDTFTGTTFSNLQIVPSPVVTSGTASGTTSSPFSYQISATNSPTTYAASGLPSGLSVNASTGAISGTPSVTGNFTVTLTASNSVGGSGTGTLTLTIVPPPPVVTSPATAIAGAGSSFAYAIAGTNSPTSYGAANLPTGLSVNTATGVVSGTVTTTGSYTFSVSATNAGGTGTANVALTVLPVQGITIYGTTADAGTIDPNTDCSRDGDVTWLPAYAATIVHPWGLIPGTTRWISRVANMASDPTTSGSHPETLDFRIRFYAPADINNAQLTYQINPDNFGDIFLNGTKLNATQIVGNNGVDATATITNANIVAGLNTIIVRLTDTGGDLGINYRVDVQGYGSTPFQRLVAPPAVANITSSTANGSYKAGVTIPIQLTFTNAVTVTGTPTLTLATGTSRTATYASGSGTTTLTFNYTVQAGDNSTDLDYASTSALALSGGTIISSAADAQAANLTLPSPGASGSLGANKALVIDTISPTFTITSAAPSVVTSSFSITFSFSEPVTFTPAISVMNGTLSNFSGSGATYTATITPQTTGPVSVTVPGSNATDAAGNPSIFQGIGFSRTYDVTPPDTAITSTPPAVSNSASATFGFSGSDVGSGVASFQTKLDNGAFTSVANPPATVSGLSDGSHTFQVRAVDAAGNVDPTPATFTWTVDTTAPDTTITSGPSTSTKNTSATFAFTGTDSGSGVASFEAKLDNGAFAAATSPLTVSGLAQGPHTFQVRAKDAAGNVDATPASYAWTVDTTAPVITAPTGPIVATATSAGGKAVTFSVTANDANDGVITPVVSPASGSVFAPGSTTVTATATDAAGNTSTATFVVTVEYLALTEDKTAVTIAQGGTATNSGTFNEASGDTVTLTPSIGSLTQTTVGQWTYQQTLTEGNHPIELVLDTAENLYVVNEANTVYKYDAAGNLVKTWTVTGTPKGIAIDNVNHWVYATSNAEGRIYKFDLNGNQLATFGSGRFSSIHCVAVDASGNVYATDANLAKVQVFDSSGNFLRQWGSGGSGDGQFNFPQGIRITSSGTVYVADRSNNRVQYFDTSGNFLGKWGSGGSGNGQFSSPASVGIDPSGSVYVGDIGNNRVQKFTATGAYVDQFGPGTGTGALSLPHGTAFPPAGRSVYIASWSSGVVQKYLTPGAWSWSYTPPANAIGTSTVTVNATTPGGATASTSFTLTITDATPPVLTLPSNITVAATSASGAVVTFSASATDNVDGNVPVTLSVSSGSTFPLGTTTVSASATDAAGNKQTGSFTVTVNPIVATITLTTPTYTYDGSAKGATATTVPAGLPVTFTYDGGSANAPINAGAHSVVATVSQSWVSGSATGSVTINPASETIFFNNTTQTYDGTPRVVTVATNPNGVAASSVVVTYDGSTTAPTNAGSYNVVGTFNNPNYTGTNSTTLTVNKRSASVALTGNVQFYDGTPKKMTVTTTPDGLTTTVTYNGSTTTPSAVGTYNVVATIVDTNYFGTGNGTLEIRDNTPPVLSLPANIVAEATSLTGTAVTYTATATDNVDGSVPVTFSKPSGSSFPLGSTTVNAIATDHAGNTAHGSFSVTVQDTTKPVLQLPADLTALATSASGAVVSFDATATDAVGIPIVKDGFESPAISNGATYVSFGTSGTSNGWNFTGYGGYLRGNADGFGPLTQIDGQQSVLVQSFYGTVSSIETASTFHLFAGATYYVSFYQATRVGYPGMTYNVTLNSPAGKTEIFRRTAASGEGFARYGATFVAATTGDYTLAFNNLNATDDATFFLDDVALIGTKVSVPTTPASGSTFPLGTTAVNATVTDFAGNTQTGSFNVTVNPATATIALTTPGYTYDGNAKVATATTSPAGLPVTFTYDAGSANAPISAGTHNVTATVSLPWISGSTSGSFDIAKATPAITVSPYSVTYDGAAHMASGSAIGAKGESLAGLDLTGTSHTNAGTFNDAWTFTDATGNYNNAGGSVTDAIAQAPLTVTAATETKVYGSSDPSLAFSITSGALAGTDTLSGGPVRVGGENVGSYAITQGTLAASANYALSYVGANLTITPKPASVTPAAATKVYGAADPAFTGTLSGFLAADNVTASYGRTAGENVAGNPYTISAALSPSGVLSNYAITAKTAAFTITPATLAVAADAKTKVYGAADPALTYGASGFQFNDTAASVLSGSLTRATGENVAGAPYAITQGSVAANSNYTIAFTGSSLAITPAPLAIVANAQTKVYGAADPALTYSVNGLQFTDTAASVLTGALARAAGENVKGSPFAITQGTLAANSNYALGYTGAALTITPATATISVLGYTGVYDGKVHGATGTATGVSSADLATMLNLGASFTNVPGGTANWTFHDPAGNYTDASGSVAITLSKADPTITVTPYAVIYDGNAHTATGTAKGVSGESLAGLDLTGTTHTAAGTFSDKWTFTDHTGNYNDATATITDAIGQAAATIAVTAYNVTYDATAHTATGTAKGVKNEPLAGLSLTGTTHTNAGTYVDTWTFTDTTGNYTNTSATVTDTIAKAPVTIALAPLAQRYDGKPKSVTATTTETPTVASLTVTITYNGSATAPTLPGAYPVVATVVDPNYVGTLSATLNVGITALVRHGVALDGDIDGSLQVLAAENDTLNGNAGITGDLLVAGLPTAKLNGHPTFAGTQDSTGAATPANYTVTLNGNALLRYLVRRVDPIAMPIVAPPDLPAGTRSVTISKSTDSAGTWATVKDLTLGGNAGNIAVPAGVYGSFTANGGSSFTLGVAGATTPSVYEFQSFTLNGNTALNIVGPVILVVKNSLTLSGTTGNTTHPEWLDLQVSDGGLTLNGNVTFRGYVTAPSGTVTVNGNTTLTGGVTADKLVIAGSSTLVEPAAHP